MASDGKESLGLFRELEGRLVKLLDEVRHVRAERDGALAERNEAHVRVRRMEAQIEALEKERKRIRDRVETLIDKVSSLDQRQKIG
jgi:chromosome segregation ATPase